ncbi:hypothetical protein M0802_001632 [Mischocyttarus mexicanus]|nr:hypothetical protein M0802_001632 [Mischocyttarus mexicanus]
MKKKTRSLEHYIENLEGIETQINLDDIKKDITNKCRSKPILNVYYCLNLLDSRSSTIFFFPKVNNIKTSIVTFIQHIQFGKIYCEEVKTWFDGTLSNSAPVKSIFEPFFNRNRLKTSCLIIFCISNNSIVKCLEVALKSWFPNSNISVWGGKILNISACFHCHNKHKCRRVPDCAAILITGTRMETYSILIDNINNTRLDIENKLKILKENVKLKKNSIGFMFSSKVPIESYELQSNIFKQFFPNMTLITYFGSEVFGGNSGG